MASFPPHLGKYDVEGIIGHGGMGVVYKALDSQIGRPVAIKMINSGGDASLIERFRSEARSTGSLHCPNIVTVYNFGEHEGNPYLVMQFLEGPSLESMIRSGVTLSLAERLGIIIDVCNGLSYAHERGVIHRDIKPANIIVLKDGMNDGMAVIVDFGIARIAGDTHLTKSDQLVGSVPYMSVEQLLAKDIDNRTDIYSTGVVLYQLLTGVLPFDAKEPPAIIFKILNEAPPPLDAYLNEYATELQVIINRILAKKREDRYSTASDLAFDLVQIQKQLRSQTVGQLLRRGELAIAQEEWGQAKDQLQQVLRIDRQNVNAQKMMSTVQQRLRRKQEVERAHILLVQAEEANRERRYDDALALITQALGLDGSNNHLLALRESVTAAKERSLALRRVLRRAEAALQDGDLVEAQSAASDALKIDAHDTQAKALTVIVAKRVEEQSRQEQLRKLLDEARGQIAAGDLTAAFATLKGAEELDPTSVEFQTVAKMAVAAREQEIRRVETEELRRQIEAALVAENYAEAVSLAEQGLYKFPQEHGLIKLKELAEAQRLRVEQKKFVREQLAAASTLADSKQLRQAISLLDRALQQIPGSGELETLRSMLRNRVEAEESAQRRLEAISATVAEAKRILQKKNAQRAREFLETHASQYSDAEQVREIYEIVRAREELDALDSKLANERNPANRLHLAEQAVHVSPHNQAIQQRLRELQEVRAQIDSALDHARELEKSGHFIEAIKEWQKLKKAYPRVPEFTVEIDRLETLRREAKKADKIAMPQTSAVPAQKRPSKDSDSFSATKVFTSAAAPDADIATGFHGTASPETANEATRTIPSPPPDVSERSAIRFDSQQVLAGLFDGPRKYLAVAAIVIVLAGGYLLWRGRTKSRQTKVEPIQVHIVTSPADAVVSSDSKPLSDETVLFAPGGGAIVVVSRLGYKTKQVEIKSASDGNIVLEPEAVHLSIQTSDKNGTVELDGEKVADLVDGNLDQFDLVPDGKTHKVSVTAVGRQVFAFDVQVTAGSVPQVNTFDATGLFLITSLGNAGKLYAVNQLKTFRIGDQIIAASPSGADFRLGEQGGEVDFGEGRNQGSVAVANSNAPTLAVYSPNVGGQIQIKSNVDPKDAKLTVNGTTVKPQRRGWLVSRPPGTYTFVLSAEGYESQTWTMIFQPGQILPLKNVELTSAVKNPARATLVITGGSPEAIVSIDGKTVGILNANGNMELSNIVTQGEHSLTLAKLNYESREFPIVVKGPEFRLLDAKLVPWPRLAFQTTVANVTVRYKRVGDSQWNQMNAADKTFLRPGDYDLVAEAAGFEELKESLTLIGGEDVVHPLPLIPIADFEFQDPKQVVHVESSWIKSKDPHAWVYLKPGLLQETFIFTKPGKGKIWFLNKKVEWIVEVADGSRRVLYSLDGQKMTRKLVAGADNLDQKEIKVDLAASGQATSLSVHIEVDGSHISISNDRGVKVDDYTAPNLNFAEGRIGIRTDSQFVVRKN